jgi:hypothetical protein
MYYVSEVLHEAKTRYLEVNKLLYAVLIASKKLSLLPGSQDLSGVMIPTESHVPQP